MHSYLQKDDSYSFSLLNEKKKKIGAEIKTVEKLSLREEWNLYLDEENLRRT